MINHFVKTIKPDFIEPSFFEMHAHVLVRPPHHDIRVRDKRKMKPMLPDARRRVQGWVHMGGDSLSWRQQPEKRPFYYSWQPKPSHEKRYPIGYRHGDPAVRSATVSERNP